MAKHIDPAKLPRVGEVRGDAALVADSVVVTRLDEAIGWARKYSIFPYPFATACCAMEYMSLSMTPYDIDRFGALLPRFTPRQADLLMVVGTVTVRQAPILRRVYDQMAEPRWVMAFGACAATVHRPLPHSGKGHRNVARVAYHPPPARRSVAGGSGPSGVLWPRFEHAAPGERKSGAA